MKTLTAIELSKYFGHNFKYLVLFDHPVKGNLFARFKTEKELKIWMNHNGTDVIAVYISNEVSE